jgi:hypothetical protein
MSLEKVENPLTHEQSYPIWHVSACVEVLMGMTWKTN